MRDPIGGKQYRVAPGQRFAGEGSRRSGLQRELDSGGSSRMTAMSRSEAALVAKRKSKRPWSRTTEEEDSRLQGRSRRNSTPDGGHRRISLRSASTRYGLVSGVQLWLIKRERKFTQRRDSNSQRLVVKRFWRPVGHRRLDSRAAARHEVQTRLHVGIGKDDTLFAKIGGIVQFEDKAHGQIHLDSASRIVFIDEAKITIKPGDGGMDASHSDARRRRSRGGRDGGRWR